MGGTCTPCSLSSYAYVFAFAITAFLFFCNIWRYNLKLLSVDRRLHCSNNSALHWLTTTVLHWHGMMRKLSSDYFISLNSRTDYWCHLIVSKSCCNCTYLLRLCKSHLNAILTQIYNPDLHFDLSSNLNQKTQAIAYTSTSMFVYNPFYRRQCH